jgi:transposase
MWPGNHSDARALLPVVDRARERFGIRRVCWVADRGMISDETIAALEGRGLDYILGARMRSDREVREEVLGRAGRYEEVAENLRVKEVGVEGRRYVLCLNPEEAEKDAADRAAVVAALQGKLKEGKALLANRGYRRFLKTLPPGSLAIDLEKVEEEARYDGKFVLRTNTELSAGEVAVQYKRLLLVERFFRDVKSVLDSRPIFHQCDDTIRGHVFASFLALLLVHELGVRLRDRGWKLEWPDIMRDLGALCEVEVVDGERAHLLRTPLEGVAGKVFKAVGLAVPPPVRPGPVVPRPESVSATPCESTSPC